LYGWPMIVSAVIPLLLLLSTTGAATTDVREILHGPDVTILFPASLGPMAAEVLEIYPAVRSDLENTLGWAVRFRPVVILLPDERAFMAVSGRHGIMALAEPDGNRMVIDSSRMRFRPDTLEATLKHELCHLILHDRIPAAGLPRWLDEGLAQWVSGGFSEVALPRRESVLDEAVLSGRLIPLKAMSRAFSREGKTLLLAYEQSLSLVTHIIDRFGVETLLALMDRLAEGVSFEDALFQTLSHTPDSLEAEWRRRLEDHPTWIMVLIGHMYEILFFLCAGAMIVGFVRHRRKKRAAMQKLEDEESPSQVQS